MNPPHRAESVQDFRSRSIHTPLKPNLKIPAGRRVQAEIEETVIQQVGRVKDQRARAEGEIIRRKRSLVVCHARSFADANEDPAGRTNGDFHNVRR
jgi:hypothetical protein